MNIVWEKPDGTIAVTTLLQAGIDRATAALGGAPTPDQIADNEAAFLVARGDVPGTWIKRGVNLSLPVNRELRAAWRHNGGAIVIDLPAAKVAFRERLAAAIETEETERQRQATRRALAGQAPVLARVVDTSTLATQVAAAPNLAALKALWPNGLAGGLA